MAINNRLNSIFNNRIHRRRITMLFFLIPNLILSVVALVAFGLQVGFDKFKEFPYIIIPIYLAVSGWMALWLKWDEPKQDEEEHQKFIEDIKQSMSEANQPLIVEIQGLIAEIRKDRFDRNKKG